MKAEPTQKLDLVIGDCTLLTPQFELLPHMDICIAGKHIVQIDKHSQERKTATEYVDGGNKLAIPGLIDAHTHISQQLMRGVLTNEYPVLYLRFNLPFENQLTVEDMQISTELACLEMIKSGITAFADAGSDHIEQILPILRASSLRGVLSRPTSDIAENLPPGRVDTLEDAVRISTDLYTMVKESGNEQLAYFFQFRSVRSCSKALVKAMVEKAHEYNTGLHAHISEYPESTLACLNQFGMREIEYLDSIEALGSNLLAAHCIQLSDNDIRLLAKRGVHVIHCPRSNLGKGITKTPQLLGSGVPVGFGTDGSAHAGLNLFREMTAFKYSQAVAWGVPYCDYQVANPKTLMEMATINSAKALLQEKRIGSLEVGKEADIALVDLDKPHITPTFNLLNTLVETVDASDINDLFIAGRSVMRNREVLSLDEERILHRAQQAKERMKARMNWK